MRTHKHHRLAVLLLIAAGVFATAGQARAGCGDYVTWRGDSPMPQSHAPQGENGTPHEEDTNQSPVPPSSPCPGAGCGPAVPPPLSTATTLQSSLERWLATPITLPAFLFARGEFIAVDSMIVLSRFSHQVYHPPR